jgi:hypothetical protein
MTTEAKYFGGAAYSTPSTNFDLVWGTRFHVFLPSASVDCTLPKARDIAKVPGGPVFTLFNLSGSRTITVKDSGGNTVRTIGTEQCVHLTLASASTDSGRWHAVITDRAT